MVLILLGGELLLVLLGDHACVLHSHEHLLTFIGHPDQTLS